MTPPLEISFRFPQALLRWSLMVALAWLFVYAVPGDWFVNWYLPMSFFLLMGLVTFGVIALGWPFAGPGGSWKPGRSRWLTGVAMTAVWLVVGLMFTALERWAWPGMPLTWVAGPEAPGIPTGVFFGIGLFMGTLWYAFDGVECRPFAKPWANWLLATGICLAIAGVLWQLFVNFVGTPLEGSSINPNGLFFGGDWFVVCVWIIVWIQAFGSPMVFQGWPFYKAGKVLYPILTTVAALLLGIVCYRVMPSLLVVAEPTFSWAAVGASMIGWSLMHSVAFEHVPFANLRQPLRGIANFLLNQIALVAVWVLLVRYVLGPPLLNHINSAFPGAGPADINLVTAWFTLHGVAVFLLIHHLFFMRVPWAIPGPPLGPEEVPGSVPR